MKKEDKIKMIQDAHKPKKFEIPKFIYAVIWKHSNGWTFACFKDTAKECREYMKHHNPPKALYDWKIIPCEVSPTLKSLLAKFGYMK